MALDRERIRSMIYEYNKDMEDQYWLNWVGLRDEVDLDGLYRRYDYLFRRDTLLEIREAFESAMGEEKRRLRALYGAVLFGYLEYETRADLAEVLRIGSVSKIEIEGREIAYRSVGPAAMNEPDRAKRREMDRLRREITAVKINPLQVRKEERVFSLIRDLGFRDYGTICAFSQDRDFESFVTFCRNFYRKSEDLYRRHLERVLRETQGIGIEEADVNDLALLNRVSGFDQHFPQDGVVPAVRKTWLGLGYDLDRQPNIHLDLDARPKKLPRACVSSIDPPVDIRLTIYPTGGFLDYESLLHESGHAEHFAHTVPDCPVEYKYWGDRGFTEGTAYLMQHLGHNPEWLKEMVDFTDTEEFFRILAFNDLRQLRRLMGQFLYQWELYTRATTEGMKEAHCRIMKEATLVTYYPETFLTHDMEFYAAGYARARLFEVQIRHYLEQRYGLRWWAEPRVRDFLEPMYRYCRRLRAEEVLADIGWNGFDADLYLEETRRVLEP